AARLAGERRCAGRANGRGPHPERGEGAATDQFVAEGRDRQAASDRDAKGGGRGGGAGGAAETAEAADDAVARRHRQRRTVVPRDAAEPVITRPGRTPPSGTAPPGRRRGTGDRPPPRRR